MDSNQPQQKPKQEPPKTPFFFQNKGDKNKKPIGGFPRSLFVWLLIGLGVVFALQSFENAGSQRETKLTYSQFTSLLNNAEVKMAKVVVVQKPYNRALLRGEVADVSQLEKMPGVKAAPDSRVFNVNLPFVDSDMLASWDKAGLQYNFETEKFNWGDVVMGILPWVIMIAFWIFMMRQMQGGQRGIFSFGKSRYKLNSLDRPQNTFKDAAGVDEAKAELEEIIEFLKDPKKFKRLGGRIPKGVLLLGPPGTGKTLLARCVAGEAGVPFLSMSGSDFVEMFVGVGASRVRDLFETAKRNAPCIIFIDEIDAVGRQRGAGLGGGHDEREQTLNQMLVEMDGFEVNAGIILIAATNRPDVLDPALLRPGRFDRQVVVDVPDIRGREGILKVHTQKTPLAADVSLEVIARGTPGFVGADLANLVNEAALMASRFNQESITMLDFEEAKDKVMMGAERRSMVLSDKEKRNTAFHEAGHAICNLHCPESDPLHKVTIIPRGRALGVTFSLPDEDKHSYTREYLLDRICIMMGGRLAEEIIFGIRTTGASNDIKQATDLARKLVCDFGMTDELGPLSYGHKEEQVFMGRDFNRQRDYSEKTAETIDGIMRRIVDEQLERGRKILTEHRDELDRLALALIEHEMLDREEIQKIITGEVLEQAKKTRSVLQQRAATAANAAAAEAAKTAASTPGKVDVTVGDKPEKPKEPVKPA